MAGLNDIITNKAMQQTTLPSWFDTAQQNVVNQAQGAFGAAPTPQNTVAQNAVSQLSQPNNAFQQAAGTAQSIASGAANPFIVNQATGQVSPNVNTALGGLFQAQNQQLNQLMPNVTAPVTGAAIGSGQFGSLRGQTAANKAMADAQAQLAAQQMQAALQNQATGVNAASTVGNLAQQDIKNLLEVGQYQQAAPFMNVANLGKVLGGIQAPTTVTNQTQLSPLNQIGGLISLLSGPTGSGGGVLGQLGIKGNLGDLIKGIGGIFTGGGGGGDVYVPGGGGTQNPYIPNPDTDLDNRDVGNNDFYNQYQN